MCYNHYVYNNFVGWIGAVLSLTVAIVRLIQILGPILVRKIFLNCLKDKLHEIKTDSTCFLLMTIACLIGLILSLTYTLGNINNTTLPMIMIKLCYIIFTIFATTSPYLICTLSCERLNSLCQEVRTNFPVKEKLLSLVDSYYDLYHAAQPYLFLSYSCSVLCITVTLWPYSQLNMEQVRW